MKTSALSAKIIFFTLSVIAAAIGVYIAYATLYRYELLVRGTLGFTTLYFIYRQIMSSHEASEEPSGIYIKFPRDLKLIFLSFIVSIITYWAAAQLLAIIKYLAKILINR